MNNKTLRVIFASIAVVAILGAIFAVGKFVVLPRFAQKDPRMALLAAAANTLDDFKKPGEPSDVSLYSLYKSLTAKQFTQNISLGVNGLGGSAFSALDPRVLSALEMITVKDSMQYDPDIKKRLDDITLNFAVTPLANVRLLTDLNVVSVSAPQAFGYAVTLNPARVTQEWDGSILGAYLGNIEGVILPDLFYEYYTRLLFPQTTPPKTNLFDLARYGALLDAGAEYIYEGRDADAESYGVTFTADALNRLLADLKENFVPARFPDDYYGRMVNKVLDEVNAVTFTESLRLSVKVKEERIVSIALAGAEAPGITGNYVTLDGSNINGEFDVNGKYGLYVSMESKFDEPSVFYNVLGLRLRDAGGKDIAVLDTSIDWNRAVGNNGISVTINALTADTETGEGLKVLFSANGSLLADAANENIDAKLSEVSINVAAGEGTLLEADLSLSVTMRPTTTVITARENTRELSSINELDVLGMYAKIRNDPDIGPLISEYLP